jgi:uncharacterized protein
VRLTEKRIDRLADRIVDTLLEEDLIDFKPTTKQMIAEVSRFIASDLAMEDEITNEAMARLATYSRKIVEGSTEWMLLLNKHKEEIATKKGYIL